MLENLFSQGRKNILAGLFKRILRQFERQIYRYYLYNLFIHLVIVIANPSIITYYNNHRFLLYKRSF